MASGSGYWGRRRKSEGLKGKSSAKKRRQSRKREREQRERWDRGEDLPF